MGKKEWLNLIHQMVRESLPNSESIIPFIDQAFKKCRYPSIFLYEISKDIQLIREKNGKSNSFNPGQFLVYLIQSSKKLAIA